MRPVASANPFTAASPYLYAGERSRTGGRGKDVDLVETQGVACEEVTDSIEEDASEALGRVKGYFFEQTPFINESDASKLRRCVDRQKKTAHGFSL